MGAFIVRRLIVNLGVFLLITMGIFALVHAAPGDPVQMMINPEQVAAGGAAFVARQRHLLGLDQGLPVQYWDWLRNAMGGHLGYSYLQDRPVTAVIGERVGPTAELMGLAVVVSLVETEQMPLTSDEGRTPAGSLLRVDHHPHGITGGSMDQGEDP